MKKIISGAAVCFATLVLASPAMAYDGILGCWFNETGAYTGRDSGQGEVGSLERTGDAGDYTYAFYIAPNTDCPVSITLPDPAIERDSVIILDAADVQY